MSTPAESVYTDREALNDVWYMLGLDVEPKGKSDIVERRRFIFTDEGELDRIIDYETKQSFSADEKGARPYAVKKVREPSDGKERTGDDAE